MKGDDGGLLSHEAAALGKGERGDLLLERRARAPLAGGGELQLRVSPAQPGEGGDDEIEPLLWFQPPDGSEHEGCRREAVSRPCRGLLVAPAEERLGVDA